MSEASWRDDYELGEVVFVEFRDRVGRPLLKGVVSSRDCEVMDALMVEVHFEGEVRLRTVHRGCIRRTHSYKVNWGVGGRDGHDGGGGR